MGQLGDIVFKFSGHLLNEVVQANEEFILCFTELFYISASQIV